MAYTLGSKRFVSIFALLAVCHLACDTGADPSKDLARRKYLNNERIRYCFNYYENRQDSLAIQSLEFLLASMPEKYSFDSLGNTKLDLDNLQPSLLIDNINQSLMKCRAKINSGNMSFSDFCEFVLPHRLSNEPLNNWRQDCLDKRYLAENGHSTSDIKNVFHINRQISNGFVFSYAGRLDKNSTWAEMENAKTGDCWVMNYASVYPLRAYGYPVAIDFVPVWGNTNGGAHSWSVFLENGLETVFMGSESSDPGYQVKRIYCEERIPPKVFRSTYSSRKELDIDENPDNIPESVDWKNRIDVTEKYTPVRNIHLYSSKLQDRRVAYLATFSNGEWVPVFWANVRNKKCKFSKMAIDVLYMAITFEKGRMQPLSAPFQVSSLTGTLKQFEVNEKALCEIKIKTTQSRAMDELLVYTLGRSGTDFFESMDSVDLDKRRSQPIPGKMYSLFYWNGRWIKSSESYADGHGSLIFHSIPSSTVYRLVKGNVAGKERLFSFDNGKQVWW